MALNMHRRHNRRFLIDLLAVAVALFAFSASAADTQATAKQSFSSGRALSGEAVERTSPDTSGAPASKQRGAVSRSLGSGFYIYDAQVTLYYDDDFDGHFYGLDVAFDADTDFFAADVYARLYLSYEGGPWEEYFTTDYFTIFGASGLDDYVVETELFVGYPTGYYDVLIELYDDFGDFVASFGPEDTSELSVLPLEDQQKDAPVIETIVVSGSSGGGGASGIPELLLLGLFALLRVRRVAARQIYPAAYPLSTACSSTRVVSR